MKNFKIYKAELYVKDFTKDHLSPVKIHYGEIDWINYKKIEDIYVKKTVNHNVVKELKTGTKIPVIYEHVAYKSCYELTYRMVCGALSSPYFILIKKNAAFSNPINFTSNVSLKDLEEYATLDYETFEKDLNYNIVAALHDEDFYLNKGMIRVSSPWREKVNTIRQKLKSKGEERKAIKKEKN